MLSKIEQGKQNRAAVKKSLTTTFQPMRERAFKAGLEVATFRRHVAILEKQKAASTEKRGRELFVKSN